MNSNQLAVQQETGLALSERHEITPSVWAMISQMAPVIHKSRMFGTASEEMAAATMLKGYEIGIGLTASFDLIQVVMGKPSLSPRGALALLHSSPVIEAIKVDRLADASGRFEGYQCYMKRTNGFDYCVRWTMEDAKRAGLIKPDSGWVNYPENMCMWRAIGFTADVVAPDVLNGMTGLMKMPERYNVALTESGDVISMEISNVARNAPQSTVDSPAPVTEFSLDEIVNMFGAEAVMNANGGSIPRDQAEINAAALVLAQGA